MYVKDYSREFPLLNVLAKILANEIAECSHMLLSHSQA